ncbi:hypothetical protein CCACVL1_30066, partial [Corchorus capsularis]
MAMPGDNVTATFKLISPVPLEAGFFDQTYREDLGRNSTYNTFDSSGDEGYSNRDQEVKSEFQHSSSSFNPRHYRSSNQYFK